MSAHDDIVGLAAEQFLRHIAIFSPATKNNGYCERNLSWHYASQYGRLHPDALVFHEVPCPGPTGALHNRIDTLILDGDLAIFIEVKQLYHVGKWQEIVADIDKLSAANLAIIRETFRGRWSRAHRLILAEVWGDSIARWWTGGAERRGWDRSPLTRFTTRTRLLTAFHPRRASWNLHWCWAYNEVS